MWYLKFKNELWLRHVNLPFIVQPDIARKVTLEQQKNASNQEHH